MTYDSIFSESITNPSNFWKEQAYGLGWFKMPQQIFSNALEQPSWFEDGELNLSYLCIDKHIEAGFGAQNAIIYDSPVTNTIEHITYAELLYQVGTLAGGLVNLGVKKGDTVVIYMPMIPQAVYAMLACVRIGAIHSVVFGGFAPNELAHRIDDCKPKIVITASNGIEVNRIIPYKPFVDQAINIAKHKPKKVVVFDRKSNIEFEVNARDVDYDDLLDSAEVIPAVPVESSHPSYILYTSGTTGKPKGIIRDTGGYATALHFSMKHVYGVNKGDVYWAASDIGWVVGHSYIVYAPLLNRNTTILFEGKPVKTPDASTFWRVISEHKVNVMFTAPTAMRAIRQEDPDGEFIKKYDLSSLNYQFLAGERCDISTLMWVKEKLGVEVIDHWWQTETGWPMVANMVGVEKMQIKPGSAGKPVCGYDIHILNEDGERVGVNEEGFVVVKLPLPPGNLTNLWGNQERFKAAYFSKFKGYYYTGDGGYMDEDGYVFITGRVDDIINVAGHRLSTVEMEEIVSRHQAVAECAVFGAHCELKGQKPVGVVVLKSDAKIDMEILQKEIVQMVRSEIGPVASFKDVMIVKRLPKTRSGKILRKLMRKIIDNEAYQIPSTIDDISVIPEIEKVLKK